MYKGMKQTDPERKAKAKEYLKKYREKNRQKIKEYHKQYSQDNKEKLSERMKKYSQKNKDTLSEYAKQYNINNKDTIKVKKKEWRKNNLEKISEQKKERYKTDPSFKIKLNIRSRIRNAIKRNSKSASTIKLIGCSIEYLIKYLEVQFDDEMTFEALLSGKIHIDHIKPCASFDLSDPEQQKICFNFKNLQPLWAEDNMTKGSKIEE